ncbi:MAG: ribonuclease HII [Pigmentiphaga sp.]|nr:ribonuclease HII [Pigmentiphaga sp.]MDX3905630.1 ribonuclease HII [Pigmentiphaga sp.]
MLQVFDAQALRTLRVAGVDEAGRGPLAGPVYAAAVVLDPARPIDGLNDSKILTERARDELAPQIQERALAWCVASVSVAEIDTLNILNATMLAMRRAVEGLGLMPDVVQVDGNRAPALPCPVQTVIGGDAQVAAISAASILAKTARDAELVRLHEIYPVYGFDRHKGYGTPDHLRCLLEHGPCPEHRRSFEPVRRALPGQSMVSEAALAMPQTGSLIAAWEDGMVEPQAPVSRRGRAKSRA